MWSSHLGYMKYSVLFIICEKTCDVFVSRKPYHIHYHESKIRSTWIWLWEIKAFLSGVSFSTEILKCYSEIRWIPSVSEKTEYMYIAYKDYLLLTVFWRFWLFKAPAKNLSPTVMWRDTGQTVLVQNNSLFRYFCG